MRLRTCSTFSERPCHQRHPTDNLTNVLLVYSGPPTICLITAAKQKHTNDSARRPVLSTMHNTYYTGYGIFLFLCFKTSMVEPLHGSVPGSRCHFVGAW